MPRLEDLGVVLVLDEEKGDLGKVALALIAQGIDALYSNDAYEGALLARQEGHRVCGVIVHADISPGRLDELIETISAETGLHPEAIAVIGPCPPAPIRQAYLERGLRWCLWSPYERTELHFIGSLALWESNDASVRLDIRVPVRVEGKLTCRGQSQPVRLVDLSRGGARLDVATRLPPGRRVQLEIEAEDRRIVLTAIVRWTTAFGSPRDPAPPGMGVEFQNPSRAARELLLRLLEAALDRYRIQVGTGSD